MSKILKIEEFLAKSLDPYLSWEKGLNKSVEKFWKKVNTLVFLRSEDELFCLIDSSLKDLFWSLTKHRKNLIMLEFSRMKNELLNEYEIKRICEDMIRFHISQKIWSQYEMLYYRWQLKSVGISI